MKKGILRASSKYSNKTRKTKEKAKRNSFRSPTAKVSFQKRKQIVTYDQEAPVTRDFSINETCLLRKIPKDDPRPIETIRLNGHRVTALLDTGAEISAISKEVLLTLERLLHKTFRMRKSKIKLITANGNQLHAQGEVQLVTEIFLEGSIKRKITHNFLICQDLNMPCVIGSDMLKCQSILIDTKTNKLYDHRYLIRSNKQVTIPPGTEKLISVRSEVPLQHRKGNAYFEFIGFRPLLANSIHREPGKVLCQNSNNQPTRIDKNEALGYMLPIKTSRISDQQGLKAHIKRQLDHELMQDSKPILEQVKIGTIKESYKKTIQQLLHNYSDVFSLTPNDIGFSDAISQTIVLKDPNEIACTPPYRIAPNLQPIVHEYVDKLYAAKVIQKSTSPFCSPLLLVRKAGASPDKPIQENWRIVQDFRVLNKNTVRDAYPLHNLYDLLDKVAASKIWSVIDLSSGFWNQNLDKASRPYTAFAVPGKGHYEYTRTAQGLCNSPSTFQRLLDYVVRGLKDVFVYIDDVVIASMNEVDHIKALEEVFARFRKYNLKCRPAKLQIATTEINYLGYNLTQTHGIRPGEAKTETIKKWLPPKNVHEIRQFLGLCNFFRRTVPHYSDLVQPLTRLQRKTSEWKEGILPKDALNAFEAIKKILITRPCLTAPNWSKEFILTVDASKTGLGAILSQDHDGIEHPIAYASKTLNETEQKYAPFRLEYLALFWGIKHFKPYLQGKHFTVRSDCRALLSFNKAKGPVYDRYLLELSQYDFTMTYIKGELMPSDGLSRLRQPVEKQANMLHLRKLVNVNWTQLKQLQQRDKYLKALVIYLLADKMPNSPELQKFIRDNKLNAEIHDGVLTTLKSQAAYAPLGLRTYLIRLAHDTTTSGHYGFKKTYERLRQYWYWPTIKSDILAYCRSCPVCIEHTLKYDKPNKLFELPPASDFNSRVHIDLLGPLINNNSYKYVFVVIDAYSRFLRVTPMQDKSMETSATCFFDNWVSIFGPPETLISDRGKEFENQIYKHLCEAFGITHQMSSPSHPSSNGMAESAVKDTIRYIRKYITEDNNWLDLLPCIQFSHNTSLHAEFKNTPYAAVFLRDPLVSYEILKPSKNKPNYASNPIQALKERLKATREDIWTQTDAYFQTMKKAYDKRAEKHRFQEGDKVFLKRPHKGKIFQKFQKLFEGPFIIETLGEKGNVKLRDLMNPKRTRLAHVNNLKLVPFLIAPYRTPDFKENTKENIEQLKTPLLQEAAPLVDVFDDYQDVFDLPDPHDVILPTAQEESAKGTSDAFLGKENDAENLTTEQQPDVQEAEASQGNARPTNSEPAKAVTFSEPPVNIEREATPLSPPPERQEAIKIPSPETEKATGERDEITKASSPAEDENVQTPDYASIISDQELPGSPLKDIPPPLPDRPPSRKGNEVEKSKPATKSKDSALKRLTRSRRIKLPSAILQKYLPLRGRRRK